MWYIIIIIYYYKRMPFQKSELMFRVTLNGKKWNKPSLTSIKEQRKL